MKIYSLSILKTNFLFQHTSMKERFNNILYIVSAIIILISTVLYFKFPEYARLAFSVSAAGLAVSRLSYQYKGENLRIKRLHRLQKIAPLFLIYASYLMYKPQNQWIPLLLAAAGIELYTTLMMEREEKKDNLNK